MNRVPFAPWWACVLVLALPAAAGNESTAPPGMVFVPAGTLHLGTTEEEMEKLAEDFDLNIEGEDRVVQAELVKERHRDVRVPAFFIDRHEVTNEAYEIFVKATGHRPPEHWPNGEVSEEIARLPVVDVTYGDATAYARWAGKRLPTELEWERAARGDDNRRFPWGNHFDDREEAVAEGDREKARKAKDSNRANSVEADKGGILEVGSFPKGKSPFGALDMGGNVWEWTSSWIAPHPGGPRTLENDYGRVLKGGSYLQRKQGVRCAVRMLFEPGRSQDAVGFRCVKSLNRGVDRLVYTLENLSTGMILPDGVAFEPLEDGVAMEEARYDEQRGYPQGSKIVGFCPLAAIAATDARGLSRIAATKVDPKYRWIPVGIFHCDYPVSQFGLEPGDYSIYFQEGHKRDYNNWLKEQEEGEEGEEDQVGEERDDSTFAPYSPEDRLVIRDLHGTVVAEIREPAIRTGSDEQSQFVPSEGDITGMLLAIESHFGNRKLVIEIPFSIDKK